MCRIFPLDSSEYELLYSINGYNSQTPVYLARRKSDGSLIAVKMLDMESCSLTIEEIRRQCQFWAISHHENMIDYYGAFVHGSEIWILTEYMNAGTIQDIMLFAFPNGFEENIVATILYYVLKFLVYFHETKQIHRNLQADNILLTKSGVVKVGGISTCASLIQNGHMKRARYTVMKCSEYVAPEILVEGTGYKENVDIWSLGILAYELCEGKGPYHGKDGLQLIAAIINQEPPVLPMKYSSAMRDFVKQCLQKNPEKRPSAAAMIKHPLMRKAKNSEYLASTIMTKLPDLSERLKVLDRHLRTSVNTEKTPQEKKKMQFDYSEPLQVGRFTIKRSNSAQSFERCQTEVHDLSTQLDALEESNKTLHHLIEATRARIEGLRRTVTDA